MGGLAGPRFTATGHVVAAAMVGAAVVVGPVALAFAVAAGPWDAMWSAFAAAGGAALMVAAALVGLAALMRRYEWVRLHRRLGLDAGPAPAHWARGHRWLLMGFGTPDARAMHALLAAVVQPQPGLAPPGHRLPGRPKQGAMLTFSGPLLFVAAMPALATATSPLVGLHEGAADVRSALWPLVLVWAGAMALAQAAAMALLTGERDMWLRAFLRLRGTDVDA